MKRGLKLIARLQMARLLLPRWIVNHVVLKLLKYFYADVYAKSTKEVLVSLGIGEETRLYAVLNAICMDLGAVPDNLPFSLHGGLMRHYSARGSIYPKKGVLEVVKSIVGGIVA